MAGAGFLELEATATSLDDGPQFFTSRGYSNGVTFMLASYAFPTLGGTGWSALQKARITDLSHD